MDKDDSRYHINYKPDGKLWRKLKPSARYLRQHQTPAEKILWQSLRNNQLGIRFRRQHAIDEHIVDFCALSIRLVIEVDGGYHRVNPDHDQIRQAHIESLGFVVVRFTNEDVLQNINTVLMRIKHMISSLKS